MVPPLGRERHFLAERDWLHVGGARDFGIKFADVSHRIVIVDAEP